MQDLVLQKSTLCRGGGHWSGSGETLSVRDCPCDGKTDPGTPCETGTCVLRTELERAV